MKNKYAVPIIILVLLLALVAVYFNMPKKTTVPAVIPTPVGNAATTTPQAGPAQITLDSVAPAKVPKGLPADLPFEKDAQILQNFEIKDPVTGKTQSTRAYVSKKTLADSFAVYQKYLSDNGWTVVSSIDQQNIKNLSATKSAARLDITFAADTAGKNTVNVTFVD